MTDRIFDISPKSSYSDYSKTNTLEHSSKIKSGTDIAKNGQELAPEIPWECALDFIIVSDRGRPQAIKGVRAIGERVGDTFLSYARSRQISFHSPELVYLSGEFFRRQFEFRGGIFQTKVNQIESGEFRLEDPAKALIYQANAINLLNWAEIMGQAASDFFNYSNISEDEGFIAEKFMLNATLTAEYDSKDVRQKRGQLIVAISKNHNKIALSIAAQIMKLRSSNFVRRETK